MTRPLSAYRKDSVMGDLMENIILGDLGGFIKAYEKYSEDAGLPFTYTLTNEEKISMNLQAEQLESASIVHIAVLKQRHAILYWLLNEKTLLQTATKNEYTPLHFACILGDWCLVGVLLSALPEGAAALALKATDIKGCTALHYAARTNFDIVLHLVRTSMKLNLKLGEMMMAEDKAQKTPLDYATEHNMTNTIDLFGDLKKAMPTDFWTLLNVDRWSCLCLRNGKVSDYQLDSTSGALVCPCIDHEKETDYADYHVNNQIAATNAFGVTEFSGINQHAKYVRLSDKTSADTLIHLLKSLWNLSKPSVIINVFGNIMLEKTSLKHTLMKGLWKSVSSENSWLITGGKFEGVSKIVGEAVRDYSDAYGTNRLFAFGIAQWSQAANNNELITSDADYKTMAPSIYPSDVSATNSSIDSNHTHFLLVDDGCPDGCDQKVACVDEFRSRLLSAVGNWDTEEAIATDKTPICGLVVGGDITVLNGVHSTIVIDKYPIVVMKGSGGLADIISEGLVEQSAVFASTAGDPEARLTMRLETLLQEIWEMEAGDEDLRHVAEIIQLIISEKHMIEIFTMEDNSTDLDGAILTSLLSSAQSEQKDQSVVNISQLKIIISLDRPDVAREKVFSQNRKIKHEDLVPVMKQALQANKVEFVKIFVENGFSLEEFLFPKKEDPGKVLSDLHKLAFGENFRSHGNDTWLKEVNGARKKSSRYQKHLNYETSYEYIKLLGEALERLLGRLYNSTYNKGNEYVKNFRPSSHLFLWAVLTNRQRMDELFWTLEWDSVGAALCGALILRQMAARSKDALTAIELEEQADYFETQAIGVLDTCYKENRIRSRTVLTRELKFYGGCTAMMLASESNSMKFVSRRCCQELVDFAWKGRIKRIDKYTKMAQALIAGILCPILVPFILDFDEITEEEPLIDKATLSEEIAEDEEENAKPSEPTLRRWAQNLMDFYKAPVVKYMYHTIFYLFYLALFTCVMMFDFTNDARLEWIYIVLVFWTSTLLCEEFRQIFNQSYKEYIKSIWNKVDMMALATFYLGFAIYIYLYTNGLANWFYNDLLPLKITGNVSSNIVRLARICLCVSLLLFYTRFLQAYTIHRNLGPKVEMIQTMITKDLIPFLFVMLVFVFAFAFAIWSVLFPSYLPKINTAINTLVSALQLIFFMVFGELNVATVAGTDGCATEDCPDEWGKWIGPVFMAVFLLLTNLLLTNLLIASFSHTYEQIQSSSMEVWAMQRYHTVKEYVHNSPLPPPFILLWHLYLIIKYFRAGCKSESDDDDPFELHIVDPQDANKIMKWEHMKMMDYLRDSNESKQREMGTGGRAVYVNKTSILSGNAGNVKREITKVSEDIEEHFRSNFSSVNARLDDLAGQINALTGMVQQLFVVATDSHRTEDVKKLNKKYQDELNKRTKDKLKTLALAARITKTNALNVKPEVIVEQPPPDDVDDSVDSAKINEIESAVYEGKFDDHQLLRFHLDPSRMDAAPRGAVLPEEKSWNVTSETYAPEEIDSDFFDGTRWKDGPASIVSKFYMKWDAKNRVNRCSMTGRYIISGDYPLNPAGRTGVTHRGHLPRWGPNHSVHMAITRWKTGHDGSREMRDNKPVIQVLLVSQSQLTIQMPWYLVCHKKQCKDLELCAVEYSKQFLMKSVENKLKTVNDEDVVDQYRILEESISKCAFKKLYGGLIEDHVNADNAWLEGVLVNIHDEDGQLPDIIEDMFSADSALQHVTWEDVYNRMTIRRCHSKFLEILAKDHNAYYT